ncbi:MAG: hypothetical protein ACI3WU_04340 [Phascolarctobacterium sp.]
MARNSFHDISLMAGAAGSIILPQAIINAWPGLFTKLAPLTSNTLPACTGSCGACGGTCLTGVSAALWLGYCVLINKANKTNEED